MTSLSAIFFTSIIIILPFLQGMGKQCPGQAEARFPCNTQPCNIQWGEWGPCSESCNRGIQTAWTECQANKGDEWRKCSETNEYKHYSFEWVRDCNTWNKSTCPSPCLVNDCKYKYQKCVDVSTDTDSKYICPCQMGRVWHPGSEQCILPLPDPPTPRPIPTLSPDVKAATTVATKSASTLLVIFLGITLMLFIFFRINDMARVIQMNMEIALICAHLCLIVPDMTTEVEICRIISILTHFFFLACFMFMFLEAVHVYALVAFVVPKDGMFTKWQNMLIGWGVSMGIVLICVGLEYENYGGKYHCWLQMDTNLVYAQFIPKIILGILIVTLIEAAGNANYQCLPKNIKMDEKQLLSAKFMQRSMLFILPMVFASFICGAYSEYDQNVYLYGIFTTLNGFLGFLIFFGHISSNQTVRDVIFKGYNRIRKSREVY